MSRSLTVKQSSPSSTATQLSQATCRPLNVADLEQLQRFLSDQMTANAMWGMQGLDYYHWKYFSRPERLSYGAFVDDALVGFLGRICRPFAIGERRYIVSEGTDAFMDRRYQGTGLFQRLIAAARRAVLEAGVAFSVARPNRNSHPGALRAGHQRLCDLALYTRPLSATYLTDRLTDKALLRALARPAFAAGQLLTTLPLYTSRLAGLRLEAVDRFDERTDQLWEKARARFGAGVVRDAAYLNWRYVECPVPYERLALYERDRLRGVAVGRLVPAIGDEPPSAEIVDLLTDADDRGPVAYLLAGALMRRLGRQGAQVIRCLLPATDEKNGDPLRKALRLQGFVYRPAGDSALLTRAEAETTVVEKLLQHGSWRFRIGDLDSG
jgi:GNAT superfamily N-acetyltransferase